MVDASVSARQDFRMAIEPEGVVIRAYHDDDDDRLAIEALFEEFQDDLVELDPLARLRRQPGYGAAQTLRTVADGGEFLVAETAGEVVGFTVGTVRTTTPEEELEVVPTTRGRVEELYVRSRYRGQGIGRALMAAVEAWFRDEGCSIINVEVFAPNERARGFYERLGYVIRDLDLIKVVES